MNNQPASLAPAATTTAAPALAAALETATPPDLQATVSDRPADPTVTMPAPAAATAEPEGLLDKTMKKFEGIFKTDESAVPETE